MKKIQYINKNETNYGRKKGYIKYSYRTCGGKTYVMDYVAMRIWSDLGYNKDKVTQIKKDIKIRKQMSSEF